MSEQKWVGRFAPTPSGPLHFGSLVAALGSYLIAKHKNGNWLVRIEDLDPPREVTGAAEDILKILESFGFEWDGDVIYQSQRSEYYNEALNRLQSKGLLYACDCSRKLIQQRAQGIYDSYCQNRKIPITEAVALRIKFNHQFSDFNDVILGVCSFKQVEDHQDFVVRRRDGLFAYQLAVVVDDIAQGISHVVRGADILDSTPRQNYLYHCLNANVPQYFHLPLVIEAGGDKLSKCKFSAAIHAKDASSWLVKALTHLGQNVDSALIHSLPKDILNWAINNWQLELIPQKPKIYHEL